MEMQSLAIKPVPGALPAQPTPMCPRGIHLSITQLTWAFTRPACYAFNGLGPILATESCRCSVHDIGPFKARLKKAKAGGVAEIEVRG